MTLSSPSGQRYPSCIRLASEGCKAATRFRSGRGGLTRPHRLATEAAQGRSEDHVRLDVEGVVDGGVGGHPPLALEASLGVAASPLRLGVEAFALGGFIFFLPLDSFIESISKRKH